MSQEYTTTNNIINPEHPELEFSINTDIYEGMSGKLLDEGVIKLLKKSRVLPSEKELRNHFKSNPKEVRAIKDRIKSHKMSKKLGLPSQSVQKIYTSGYKSVSFEVTSKLVEDNSSEFEKVFLGSIMFTNAAYDKNFGVDDLETEFRGYFDSMNSTHIENVLNMRNPLDSIVSNTVNYVSCLNLNYLNKNFPGFNEIIPQICSQIIDETKVKNPRFIGLEGLI